MAGPVVAIHALNRVASDSHPVRANHARQSSEESEIVTRFSSLTRLLRFVTLCRRPLVRLRAKRKLTVSERLPFLTSVELSEAQVSVIRLTQASAFALEIGLLSSGKRLPKSIRLSTLRVGGRLANSALTRSKASPNLAATLCS